MAAKELSNREDLEMLLHSDEFTLHRKSDRKESHSISQRQLWLFHGAVFALYTVAFLLLSTSRRDVETDCVLEQSMYSPVHESVEYSVVRFNATLDFPSPYSGTPSKEIDEAWDRITTNNTLWPIRVSDRELNLIQKGGRGSNVKFSDLDGGGSLSTIEVFHQLHCLNMLRKYTFPEDYPALQQLWKKRPDFMRSHLNHCIEIIRQNLMCTSDIGVISYDWIVDHKVPFPDFNTYHKCRNFDKILDWTEEHRLHIPAENIKRLYGTVDLLEPPQ